MNTKKKTAERIEILIILILLEMFFFRNILFTPGAMLGDAGDGLFTNLVTEHWYKVLLGREAPADLPIFYPIGNTVSYSDALLGFGIVNSALRLLGMNMFLSYKCTIIFFHFIGAVSFCYFLREKLNISEFFSLIGTSLFALSDTYGFILRHTQLVAISLLPVILILLYGFFKNFDNNKKRNLYAEFSIIIMSLMAYTSWYSFFFMLLFLVVFFITYFICLLMKDRGRLKYCFKKFFSIWKSLILYLITLTICFIPFVVMCYPLYAGRFKRPEIPGQSYRELSIYLPEPADLLNIRDSNLLFGNISLNLELSTRLKSEEIITGFTPVFLILFLISLCHIKRSKDRNIKILSITVIIGFFLCLSLSSNGASLWYFIHYHIPGARSIRAVSRFFFFLSLPMAGVVSYSFDRALKEYKHKNKIEAVLLVLVFLSNINLTGVNSEWNYKTEIDFLNSIEKPEEDFVFYISVNEGDMDEKRSDLPFLHTFSYEIAEWLGVKTINGYSGNSPAGWRDLWDVYSPEYESNIMKWQKKTDIENLYRFDVKNKSFEKIVTP